MKWTPEMIRLMLKAMRSSERRLENASKAPNASELILTRQIITDLKQKIGKK